MPCRDGGPSIDEEYRERLDKLTRMLCSVLKKGDKTRGFMFDVDYETRQWWEIHKKEDAKREAEEQEAARLSRIKAGALLKLTAEERRVLGVK